MNLLGTILEESPHVILQLGTTYDRVVTEHHALIFQQRRVGNQLHLRHQSTALLIARCERTGPCGGVFQDGTLVWDPFTLGITQGHTDAGVRYTTDAIHLGIIILTHLLTIGLTHCLHINTIIVGCRETIIYPQERTDLLTFERLLQHFHRVGCQEDDLTRTEVSDTMEIEIRETRSLTRNSISTVFLSDDDRRTTQEVTGCDNAFLREDQHRA